MNFETFRFYLVKYLPKDLFTVGNDLSVNTMITVDSAGYVFLRKPSSFIRIQTSININHIAEFRQDDRNESSFFVITQGYDALFFNADKGEFFFYEKGEPTGDQTAIDYFIEHPVA